MLATWNDIPISRKLKMGVKDRRYELNITIIRSKSITFFKLKLQREIFDQNTENPLKYVVGKRRIVNCDIRKSSRLKEHKLRTV